MGTVAVACSVPNGLSLRLAEKKKGVAGEDVFVPVGAAVELAGPGNRSGSVLTEVDEDFWFSWLELFGEHNDFLARGLIDGPRERPKRAAPEDERGASAEHSGSSGEPSTSD